jgi:hypothetical protein
METSMLETMEKYGVSLANAGQSETIIGLRTLYVQGLSEVSTKQAEAEKSGESLLKQVSSLTDTAENRTEVAELRKQLRSIVFGAIESNPQLAMHLGEVLGELKTDVLGERDYLLGKVRQEMAPKQSIPTDELSERKDDLSELAKLIRWLWDLVKNETFVKTSEFKSAFPIKAKTENGQPVKGVFIPDLPKLPRTASDNSAPVGRAAVIGRMSFVWNGDAIPVGTFPSDIAHDYVSDAKSGFVVDLRGIQEAVKATGGDFYSDAAWTVDFPTGTLGRMALPKKQGK